MPLQRLPAAGRSWGCLMQNELTNKTMAFHESRDFKAAHRHKARKKAAKMEPFRKGFTAAVIPEDPVDWLPPLK
ncbi:uncharacterized protein QC761_0006090 [Podospora bellae-mahoneyi]|uniref:Uncharacterized protein n=1 Tax=Podospora bellae-mahoneyi TaxID=2093777 RepID=A0ABR0FX76_9PEZI|nr:hypothetical protein QC761_0006090 [Podospora bellae-mahoneyi]